MPARIHHLFLWTGLMVSVIPIGGTIFIFKRLVFFLMGRLYTLAQAPYQVRHCHRK